MEPISMPARKRIDWRGRSLWCCQSLQNSWLKIHAPGSAFLQGVHFAALIGEVLKDSHDLGAKDFADLDFGQARQPRWKVGGEFEELASDDRIDSRGRFANLADRDEFAELLFVFRAGQGDLDLKFFAEERFAIFSRFAICPACLRVGAEIFPPRLKVFLAIYLCRNRYGR